MRVLAPPRLLARPDLRSRHVAAGPGLAALRGAAGPVPQLRTRMIICCFLVELSALVSYQDDHMLVPSWQASRTRASPPTTPAGPRGASPNQKSVLGSGSLFRLRRHRAKKGKGREREGGVRGGAGREGSIVLPRFKHGV